MANVSRQRALTKEYTIYMLLPFAKQIQLFLLFSAKLQERQMVIVHQALF